MRKKPAPSVISFKHFVRKKEENAPYSYYTLRDDFVLWRGAVVEVEWATFNDGELHVIELTDGRRIVRYVRPVTHSDGEEVLEIYGSNGKRELLRRSLVRRIGAVSRVFYVHPKGCQLPDLIVGVITEYSNEPQKVTTTPADVVQIGAWLDSHSRPIRNLLFAEKKED